MAKCADYECFYYAIGFPFWQLQCVASLCVSCRKDRTALALLMTAIGEEQLDDFQCDSAFKLRGLKLTVSRGHDCPQDSNEHY
jgi:hypothetical protein